MFFLLFSLNMVLLFTCTYRAKSYRITCSHWSIFEFLARDIPKTSYMEHLPYKFMSFSHACSIYITIVWYHMNVTCTPHAWSKSDWCARIRVKPKKLFAIIVFPVSFPCRGWSLGTRLCYIKDINSCIFKHRINQPSLLWQLHVKMVMLKLSGYFLNLGQLWITKIRF